MHAPAFRYANGVVPFSSLLRLCHFLRSHFIRRDSSIVRTVICVVWPPNRDSPSESLFVVYALFSARGQPRGQRASRKRERGCPLTSKRISLGGLIAPTCAFFFARFSGVKFPLSEIIPDRIARDELARCRFSVLGVLSRAFLIRVVRKKFALARRSLSDKTRRDLDLSRNSAKFARPLGHKLAPICNSLIIAVISHAGHRRSSFFPPLPYSSPSSNCRVT